MQLTSCREAFLGALMVVDDGVVGKRRIYVDTNLAVGEVAIGDSDKFEGSSSDSEYGEE